MKTDAEERQYWQGILKTALSSVPSSAPANVVTAAITPLLAKENFTLTACQARGAGRYAISIERTSDKSRFSLQIS